MKRYGLLFLFCALPLQVKCEWQTDNLSVGLTSSVLNEQKSDTWEENRSEVTKIVEAEREKSKNQVEYKKEIIHVDCLPENGELLANDLLKIVKLDAELEAGLQNLKNSTPLQLKKIYHLAQELNSTSATEQILDTGLKREDPFFCLERYRFLVEKGEMKTEEALLLRQKLIGFGPESDPINGQGIPFTLALIDFQALSQQNFEPEVVAQPLIEYLMHVGDKDQKNIWRIEMMIAETYLDADQWEQALKHAEEAYKAAPTAMHEEIAHSLDYIRSQSIIR